MHYGARQLGFRLTLALSFMSKSVSAHFSVLILENFQSIYCEGGNNHQVNIFATFLFLCVIHFNLF